MVFQVFPTKCVDFLVFLEQSATPFMPPSPKAVADLLIPEIDNPKLTPYLLQSLNMLDIIEHFPRTDPFIEFIHAANNLKSLPSGSLLRTPSAEFKHFCGAESLTSSGKITRDDALTCIMRYINRNMLRGTDDYVHIDTDLRTALRATCHYYPMQRLTELVESIF